MTILIIMGIILIIAFVWFIEALFFWGIGNLLIFLFGLKMKWTFLHGLGIAIIELVLKLIFRNSEK